VGAAEQYQRCSPVKLLVSQPSQCVDSGLSVAPQQIERLGRCAVGGISRVLRVVRVEHLLGEREWRRAVRDAEHQPADGWVAERDVVRRYANGPTFGWAGSAPFGVGAGFDGGDQGVVGLLEARDEGGYS